MVCHIVHRASEMSINYKKKLTVLNFGQVLACGDTSEVLKDPKVITAYLGE